MLATIDTSTLFADATIPPTEDAHQFAATVRVRAITHYGDARGDVEGTFRKTFFVHRDPMLHEAFPRWMGASGESSPRLHDLDGDRKDELVIATADGLVHVLDVNGEEWPGFPVRLHDVPRLAAHAGAPGWQPGALGPDWQESLLGAVSIGDVTGDGRPELVVATLEGRVHVIATDGTIVRSLGIDRDLLECDWGLEPANPAGCRYTGARKVVDGAGEDVWEHRLFHPGFFAAPVLADYTGDGALDIVQAGMDGVLYVWDGTTGEDVPGFPVRVYDPRPARGENEDGDRTLRSSRAEILSTPAVADLDGDGKPELLLGTNEVYGEAASKGRMYLIKGTGGTSPDDPMSAWWPGWPIEAFGLTLDILPMVGRGAPNNPVIADMDGDGVVELGAHAIAAQPNFFRWKDFEIVDGNLGRTTDNAFLGTGDNSTPGPNASSDDLPSWIPVNSGSVADLDGDGLLEYVCGTIGSSVIFGIDGGQRGAFDHQVAAWSIGNAMRDTDLSRNKFTAPMLPGFPQKVDDYMFFVNYAVGDVDGDGRPEVVNGTGGYRVTAFNADGEQPAGWPKHTGSWIASTAALGDLDGDGFLDVVVHGRDGWLYAWRTTGSAKSIQWEGFHHDARSTGNFSTPLPERLGPEDVVGGDGGDGGGEGGEGGSDAGGCCSVAGTRSGAAGTLGLALALALLRARRRR